MRKKLVTPAAVVVLLAVPVMFGIGNLPAAEQQESSAQSGAEVENAPKPADTETAGQNEDQQLPAWLTDSDDSIVGADKKDLNLARELLTALVLVGVLGGAAWFVFKKFAPKNVMKKGKDLDVLETVTIGSGRNLHIVKIASGRKLLIASTTGSVNFIADVTDDVETGTGGIDQQGAII